MPDDALPLLNVYEVPADDGRIRHLLIFLEPTRAQDEGIASRAVVGEVTPTDYGGYIPSSLVVNPDFLGALVDYMNEVVAATPEVARQAEATSERWAYVLDPRNRDTSGALPPSDDVIGAFAIDAEGQVIPDSFRLNEGHVLIDQDRGFSGLLTDRRFYDWMHPPVPAEPS